MAILPMAITLGIARAELVEEGYDADVMQLAPDAPAHPIAKELVTHPAVGIVDFTGSNAFGEWVREKLAQVSEANERRAEEEARGTGVLLGAEQARQAGALGIIHIQREANQATKRQRVQIG